MLTFEVSKQLNMAKAFNISDTESVREYLSKFSTRGELSKKNTRHYLLLKNNGLLDQFLPSKQRGRHKKVIEFSVLESVSIGCKNRSELHKADDKIYRQAVRTGEINKLFPDTKNTERWSKDKVFLAASLCKNKNELNNVYRGAYNFARENKILHKLKFAR